MSGTGSDTGGDELNMGTASAPPMLQVIRQYIKDLSFENPGATASIASEPQVELNLDVQARAMDPEVSEVELKLRVSAASDGKPVFLFELVYAGLFRLRNCPEELRKPILMIQSPALLFPFARRIVAEVVRDGGMPPFQIDPIDFSQLYRAQVEGAPQMRSGTPAAPSS